MLDKPVTREQSYLHAILEELRAIRKALAPPIAQSTVDEEDLFGDEIPLRESDRTGGAP